MYIVLIGWLYVTMMMAVVEATSDTGTVLGAIITFVLYGLLPAGIGGYLMATPARKRASKAREAALFAASSEAERMQPDPDPNQPTLNEPNAGCHAPAATQAAAIPSVRKEP